MIADIVVLAPSGSSVALVEVKNPAHLTREMATILRRNLVARGLDDRVPFFLMVSQDRGFIWDQRQGIAPIHAPTAEFSMVPVVQRYLPDLEPHARLHGFALDIIVIQWINDLSLGVPAPSDEPERSLAAAGFLEAIRDGIVLTEDAA